MNPSKALPQTSHGASFGDQGAAHTLTFPPAGRPKAGGGERGVCSIGAGRDHQAVEQPLGLSLHMVKKPDGSWWCCGD
jgi:hypothetical protein